MDSLLNQLKETFPDIQEADFHRILDFFGYSSEDIFEPNPPYRLINGETIFVPSCIALDDSQRTFMYPPIDIQFKVSVVQDDVSVSVKGEANGTKLVFT